MKLKPQTNLQEQLKNISEYKEHYSKIKEIEHSYHNDQIALERLKMLLDPNSYFFELSRYASLNSYNIKTPGAGIITGIGQICKKPCMILANKPSVKAGCYFPITIEKTIRALKIARDFKLPCIHLVDSGGAFLPMQSDLFANEVGFGRIFYEQAQISNSGIMQYSAILNSCTAGGAYIPMMTDECVMVKNSGALFLAGPTLVAAATGEKLNTQDLGGSKIHCHQSGIVHKEADSEHMAIKWLRDKVAKLPGKELILSTPKDTPTDLTGFIPYDHRHIPDIEGIMANILDDGNFLEFQSSIGQSIRVGWGKIHGKEVGVIANDGIMDANSMIKANKFLLQCDKISTPVLFLHNTHGMLVGSQAEKSGIARHGANMIKTIATMKVRRFTIMIGNSYGAGNYAMSGRAFKPSFLFQWPNNKIAIMGPKQQEFVMASLGKSLEINPDTHSAIYHSANLRDDGIIMPNKTRDIIGMLLKLEDCYDRT